jgi:kinesin family member 23
MSTGASAQGRRPPRSSRSSARAHTPRLGKHFFQTPTSGGKGKGEPLFFPFFQKFVPAQKIQIERRKKVKKTVLPKPQRAGREGMMMSSSPLGADNSVGAINMMTPSLTPYTARRRPDARDGMTPGLGASEMSHDVTVDVDASATLDDPTSTSAMLENVTILESQHRSRKVRRRPEESGKPSDNNSFNMDPMRVYCRIKPGSSPSSAPCLVPAPSEDDSVARVLTARAPPNSFVYRQQAGHNSAPEQQFSFTGVLGEGSTQEGVFGEVAVPLLENLFKGVNSLLFAFGMTNAGKTFTMNGEESNPGILPRCLDTIFNSVDGNLAARKEPAPPKSRRGAKGQSRPFARTNARLEVPGDKRYLITMTFLEIYNEHIYDLLADVDPSVGSDKRPCLHLKEGPKKKIYVHKLTEEVVYSVEEAHALLQKGNQNRKVGETLMNRDSSRSHGIITIKLMQLPKGVDTDTLKKNKDLITISTLSLVDLAGSERNKRTAATGERQREASSINSSLMTLGRCITAIRRNQVELRSRKPAPGRAEGPTARLHVVPYRNSKLTRLFQDYFTGHGKAAMIANVSPCASDFDETFQTLRFAVGAKQIQTGQDQRHRLGESKTAGEQALHLRAQTLERREMELQEFDAQLAIEFDEALARAQDEIEERVRQEVALEFRETIEDMKQRLTGFTIQQTQVHQDNFERRMNLLQARSDAVTEEMGNENEELNDELDALQDQFDDMKEARSEEEARAKKTIDGLTEQLELRHRECEVLNKDKKQLQESLAEVEQLRLQNAELMNERDILAEENAHLRKEVEDIQESVKQTQVAPLQPGEDAHTEHDEVVGLSPVSGPKEKRKKEQKRQARHDKEFKKGLKAIDKKMRRKGSQQEVQEENDEPLVPLQVSFPVRPRRKRRALGRASTAPAKSTKNTISTRLRPHNPRPLDETFASFM